MTRTVAVVVAAGRGLRMAGADAVPKQYRLLAGVPLLSYSLRALTRHHAIDAVAVVIHPDDRMLYTEAARQFAADLAEPVLGGATRQDSVRHGLEAFAATAPDRVLIHDAARPFLTGDLIDRLLAALDLSPAAIAAEPVADTLKRASTEGTVAATVDRENLWRAQTPQAFRFDDILAAHRRAAETAPGRFTDDAGLAEWAGLPVKLVASGGHNMKLTTADDTALAERLLASNTQSMETRVGNGFDVHAFAPGDHVWLCGVKIAHTHKLEGHSDADAPLHALTDALLGAIGDGDIGQHFPPSEPEWRGCASRVFLEDAGRRVRALSGKIVNVDVTILCETPKIGPHRTVMCETVAAVLGLDVSRVGVKATTMEGLGFVGRGEGIAAMASATVLLPA
jgi:2-C-methyl-D-erythritol 4-phosphate cytidylyltransferase / 2-C-methyl-D-erythritol 2,4-cyclodiphosphate synthase